MVLDVLLKIAWSALALSLSQVWSAFLFPTKQKLCLCHFPHLFFINVINFLLQWLILKLACIRIFSKNLVRNAFVAVVSYSGLHNPCGAFLQRQFSHSLFEKNTHIPVNVIMPISPGEKTVYLPARHLVLCTLKFVLFWWSDRHAQLVCLNSNFKRA